jgi:hypothetical protein
MSSTGFARRRFGFSVRPLLLFVHENCQGKTTIGNRAVSRFEAALQTRNFYPKLQ